MLLRYQCTWQGHLSHLTLHDPRCLTSTPDSQITSAPALIDTGAHQSCIDEALAQEIKLPVIDRQRVSGVGGETEVNVYLAHIHYPALNFTQWGRFSGARLQEGGQPHVALIGRTLLSQALLVYDGQLGNVTIAI